MEKFPFVWNFRISSAEDLSYLFDHISELEHRKCFFLYQGECDKVNSRYARDDRRKSGELLPGEGPNSLDPGQHLKALGQWT